MDEPNTETLLFLLCYCFFFFDIDIHVWKRRNPEGMCHIFHGIM